MKLLQTEINAWLHWKLKSLLWMPVTTTWRKEPLNLFFEPVIWNRLFERTESTWVALPITTAPALLKQRGVLLCACAVLCSVRRSAEGMRAVDSRTTDIRCWWEKSGKKSDAWCQRMPRQENSFQSLTQREGIIVSLATFLFLTWSNYCS